MENAIKYTYDKNDRDEKNLIFGDDYECPYIQTNRYYSYHLW